MVRQGVLDQAEIVSVDVAVGIQVTEEWPGRCCRILVERNEPRSHLEHDGMHVGVARLGYDGLEDVDGVEQMLEGSDARLVTLAGERPERRGRDFGLEVREGVALTKALTRPMASGSRPVRSRA